MNSGWLPSNFQRDLLGHLEKRCMVGYQGFSLKKGLVTLDCLWIPWVHQWGIQKLGSTLVKVVMPNSHRIIHETGRYVYLPIHEMLDFLWFFHVGMGITIHLPFSWIVDFLWFSCRYNMPVPWIRHWDITRWEPLLEACTNRNPPYGERFGPSSKAEKKRISRSLSGSWLPGYIFQIWTPKNPWKNEGF